MRIVVWSAEARADVGEIAAYIGQFNERATDRLSTRLLQVADSLSEFTERGELAGDYRKLVTVRPYVLRYRIVGDEVRLSASATAHDFRTIEPPSPLPGSGAAAARCSRWAVQPPRIPAHAPRSLLDAP